MRCLGSKAPKEPRAPPAPPDVDELFERLFPRSDRGSRRRRRIHLSSEEKAALARELVSRDADAGDASLYAKLAAALGEASIAPGAVRVEYRDLEVAVQAAPSVSTNPSLLQGTLDALRFVSGRKHAHKRPLRVLGPVSGALEPGRLTLLLGPPGAGKSLFLRALAGRLGIPQGDRARPPAAAAAAARGAEPSSDAGEGSPRAASPPRSARSKRSRLAAFAPDVAVTGSITYNGVDQRDTNPRRVVSLIHQDTALLPNYPVLETLQFSFDCLTDDAARDKSIRRLLELEARWDGEEGNGGEAWVRDMEAGTGREGAPSEAGAGGEGAPSEAGAKGRTEVACWVPEVCPAVRDGDDRRRPEPSSASGASRRPSGSPFSTAAPGPPSTAPPPGRQRPTRRFLRLLLVAQACGLLPFEVMEELGLAHARHTVVGNAMTRGVSGGERRRVAAAEALVGPQMVVLGDEISTGLDSATTYSIVRYLKEATAYLHRTTLLLLLQPAPEVIDLFDDLVLLTDGRVLYHGPVREALPFFASQGFVCPPRKDPGAFFMEIGTPAGQAAYATPELLALRGVDPAARSPRALIASPPKSLLVTPEELSDAFWRKSALGKAALASLGREAGVAARGGAPCDRRGEAGRAPLAPSLPPPGARHAKPTLRLYALVFRRQFDLTFVRSRAFFLLRAVQAGVVGLVVGSLFVNITPDAETWRSAAAVSVVTVLFLGFMSMPQLALVLSTRPVFLAQRDAGAIPPASYSFALAAAQVVPSTVEAVIFGCFVYWMVGLYPSASRFVTYLAVTWSASNALAALFRLIAFFAPNAIFASCTSSLTLLTLVSVNGFTLVRQEMRGYVIWIYYASPIAWAVRALTINEFTSPQWDFDVPLLPGVRLGTFALESFGMGTDRSYVYASIGVNWGLFLVYTLAGAVALALVKAPSPRAVLPKDEARAEAALRGDGHDEALERAALATVAQRAHVTHRELADLERGEFRRERRGCSPEVGREVGGYDGLESAEGEDVGGASTGGLESAKGEGIGGDSSDGLESAEGEGVGRASAEDTEGCGSKRASETPSDDPTGSPTSTASVARDGGRSIERSPGPRALHLAPVAGANADAPRAQRNGDYGFVEITLVCRDLCYYVNDSSRGTHPSVVKESPDAALRGKLQLLHDVSFFAQPGELMALMGGSGAGKTTLMDVVCGRKTVGVTRGEILVNGHPKVQETWSRVVGYVEQSDVHSARVTVYESLLFSARLRLPGSTPLDEVRGIVESTLQMVELDAHSWRVVGDPGGNGLSIEQRKRLSIAVELVANPSVVFMDEPTSGLDARAAAIVMRAVRNVADSDRTVMVTIHQPSIELFETFDTMVLMHRGGRLAYFGELGFESSKLVEYLEGYGVERLRPGHNPATWMLEVTGGSMSTTFKATDLDFPQLYLESELYARNRAEGERLARSLAASHAPISVPARYATGFWTQSYWLVRKYYQMYWHSPDYVLIRQAFSLIIALVLGVIFLRRGKVSPGEFLTFGQVQAVIGVTFTSIIFQGFFNYMSVQATVQAERLVFYRDRAASAYGSGPLSLALLLVELPYVALQAFTVSVPMYLLLDFEKLWWKFWYFTLMLFVTLLLYTSFGQAIVIATPNPLVAQLLGAVLNQAWTFFNGFLIPYPQIGRGWKWMNRISPSTWILDGIATSQLGDRENPTIDGAGAIVTTKAYIKTAFAFDFDFIWWCPLIVVAHIVAFRVLIAVVLRFVVYQRR